ncbi:zinc-binding protein A33-like [Heterodontus francisci]|uniref:zinc-binding protein A33-like n=1 Tax=Heterodontus francisci TaxID=7792 RepID=UPI00355BD951
MASREQIRSLTEDLNCSICSDFFTDPVSLECGHNFCRSCITQYWEKKEINSCPECREEFPERNLRKNRVLVSLTEKARKLKMNPEEKESKVQCEEHREELKLFCKTDKKLICDTCRDSQEHKAHNFLPIKEAVQIYKNQVKLSLDSLTGKKSAAIEMERRQKQKSSEIREQSNSLQTHITSEFNKMYQILTEKKQRLIRDLREQEEKILEPMEKNLCDIKENLNAIQEKVSKLQKQLEQEDAVKFLKEAACWKRRISDEDFALSLADDDLSIGKFNSTLPYPVWREMLDSINPVSVTLDMETVNPELEVTEDRKSVRRTGTERSLPETGKRFTAWCCVLGSEGFTSGRYYWEVEVVGNRDWSLGVATESVERKKGFRESPQIGFWSIEQVHDQFYVNSVSRCALPADQIPGKVGVYLCYESGTVSFYCADTKSHLHTFTGNKFTEKLYPFFRSWDVNKWLRICPGSDPDLE